MNFDRYIISFKPGSSGRFIKFILISLLTDSNADIQLSEVNDTHLNDVGQAFGTLVLRENMHKSNVYSNVDTIFDNYAPVRVFPTHAYPKINAIKCWDVLPGIILITIDPADKAEIELNHIIKNKFVDLNSTNLTIDEIIKKSLQKTMWTFNNPIESDIVLSLKYADIFTPTEHSYLGLEHIEHFTGLKASEKVKQNYKKYVDGRKNFIEKHQPILNEITSFFDKYY